MRLLPYLCIVHANLTVQNRNSKRRWKSTVASIIAGSRLSKGGLANRERADSSATSTSVDSDDEEDGFHTGDEGELERRSREIARVKVEQLSEQLKGLKA